MKGIAKERTIYDNYYLWKTYPDDMLTEMAHDCEWIEENEEPSDEQLWEWRYEQDQFDWENEKSMLENFFEGKTVGFFGSVGLWHGVYKAGNIGEFWDLFHKAITDCDYIKLYDENGHFYLTCTHHDGTCHFEVKEITDKGREYLENWEDNWNDKRTEEYCHDQIYKRYSKIPRYAQKVFGCKAREYEPQSKEGFTRMLNNQARSFYS